MEPRWLLFVVWFGWLQRVRQSCVAWAFSKQQARLPWTRQCPSKLFWASVSLNERTFNRGRVTSAVTLRLVVDYLRLIFVGSDLLQIINRYPRPFSFCIPPINLYQDLRTQFPLRHDVIAASRGAVGSPTTGVVGSREKFWIWTARSVSLAQSDYLRCWEISLGSSSAKWASRLLLVETGAEQFSAR